MSEAPPVESPNVFPVMSSARIRSHVWGLFIYGMGLYLGITGIKRHLASHRSIAFDIFILILSVFMFAVTGLIWFRDQGSQIIIQGNRIELKSVNGEVRSSGLISDIIDLRATQSRLQGRPWSYIITFSNRRRIVFDRNVPNLHSLVGLLEQRTGRQFIIDQS